MQLTSAAPDSSAWLVAVGCVESCPYFQKKLSFASIAKMSLSCAWTREGLWRQLQVWWTAPARSFSNDKKNNSQPAMLLGHLTQPLPTEPDFC